MFRSRQFHLWSAMAVLTCLASLLVPLGQTQARAIGGGDFSVEPKNVSPGDAVTVSGVTTHERCEVGTVDAAIGGEWLTSYGAGGGKDPRTGAQDVLFTVAGARQQFSREVVVPAAATGSQLFVYMWCEGSGEGENGFTYDFVTLKPQTGDRVTPSPDPRGKPVARPDVYAAPAGDVFVSPRSVLANDTDPKGEPLLAAREAHVSTLAGRVVFRPNGTFEIRPAQGEGAGVVCIEYRARASRGAESSATTVVISFGEADPEQAVSDATGRCDGASNRSQNDYEFDLEVAPTSFPLSLGRDARPPSHDGRFTMALGATAAGSGQYRLAAGAYGGPYRICNDVVAGTNIGGLRYGSMTAFAFARRSLPNADYVKMRYAVYEDSVHVHTFGWKKKVLPAGSDISTYVTGKIHIRFGSPGVRYEILVQVVWYDDNLGWWRDDVLGRSRFYNVGFSCVSGGV